MRLLRAGNGFVLQLGKREKHLLTELLKLYPQIPPAHRYAKGSSPLPESSLKLLDEALAEQRTANQRQVKALLGDPRRFEQAEGAWRLALSAAEVEWLLQVLNDVRVGSWLALGSPEQLHDPTQLTQANAAHFWSMEMAGFFQMELLASLNR